MKYKVKAKLWLWGGAEKGAWHFVTIPPEISEKIEKKFRNLHGGWGSLKVLVRFQLAKKETVELETSIFKNRREKNCLTYLLPIKKKIRSEIGAQSGDIIEFVMEVKV
jgi:hypothetical protein